MEYWKQERGRSFLPVQNLCVFAVRNDLTTEAQRAQRKTEMPKIQNLNHEEHPELNERTHLTGQAKKN